MSSICAVAHVRVHETPQIRGYFSSSARACALLIFFRMKSFRARALWAGVMMCSAFAACGGTIASSEITSTPDSGASSGGGSAIDAGRTKPDSGTSSEIDAAVCVDIETSDYDTSCNQDTDCIVINTGEICSGYNCLCGGSTVNADGQAQYDNAISSVDPGPGPMCGCPYFGRPRCIQNVCTFCPANGVGSTPAGCPDGG